MANEFNIGPLAQIPPGEGRVFTIGSKQVAVFHGRDAQVYATQPDCPHLGGPLADGLIGSGTLMCPLHDRLFDLSTGKSTNTDCAIAVYPARLTEKAEILVAVDG